MMGAPPGGKVAGPSSAREELGSPRSGASAGRQEAGSTPAILAYLIVRKWLDCHFGARPKLE